ncbi:MAG: ABC transporter ATP-binding protein [Caldisericia bacterium]|nr:ABC transporter ATP-binding protein [Caldisericia bacterium]
MKNPNSLILLTKISKNYHRGNETVHALQEVDLSIERGDFIAFMGASGSGKSTLLNVIGGLDQCSSGSYLLNGVEVSKVPEKKWIYLRRQWFGYVFQSFHLIPTLTVKENIELPLLFAGKQKLQDKIHNTLVEIGLDHRMNHLPSQLSGGEMQRTAIARAVVHNPPILIADEPTGNLDSENATMIFRLFQTLNQKHNITILCATHDPALAKQCSRIVLMKDGTMWEE